jgi:hypothetical protein
MRRRFGYLPKRLKNAHLDEVVFDKFLAMLESNKHKLVQEDCDASWTKKNEEHFFGYKDHPWVDAFWKLMWGYAVTTAKVNDSVTYLDVIPEKPRPGCKKAYSDSAYSSKAVGANRNGAIQSFLIGVILGLKFLENARSITRSNAENNNSFVHFSGNDCRNLSCDCCRNGAAACSSARQQTRYFQHG